MIFTVPTSKAKKSVLYCKTNNYNYNICYIFIENFHFTGKQRKSKFNAGNTSPAAEEGFVVKRKEKLYILVNYNYCLCTIYLFFYSCYDVFQPFKLGNINIY